jgi:hypothetical protein
MTQAIASLMSEALLRRFYANCVVDLSTGCWNWRGEKFEGRGVLRLTMTERANMGYTRPGLYEFAARLGYQHFVGPIPMKHDLAHTKQGDTCIFWGHVRPLTRSENMREAYGTLECCPHGHLRSVFGVSSGGGCKACVRIYTRRAQGRPEPELCCGFVTCRCEELMSG